MSANIEELERLLLDWEINELDESGIHRVREILRTDSEARAYFVQYQTLSTALHLESEAGLAPVPLETPEEIKSEANFRGSTSSEITGDKLARARTSESSRDDNARRTTDLLKRRLRSSHWLAAAAAVLVIILGGRLVYIELLANPKEANSIAEGATNVDSEEPDVEAASKEATSQGVAVITRLVDIEWDEQQTPFEVGDALLPGPLRIESGFVQVEFFSGATVVIEGPAELDLHSPTLASVRNGRLRAHVPPAARGFSLEVDDMTVVDLGTEFGLDVSDSGADLQVFDGEVALQRAEQEEEILTTGEAIIKNADGEYVKSETTPDRFLDINALESRDIGQGTQRFERWNGWSQQQRQDPRLIAYYAFDDNGGWKRELQSSLEPANSDLDGAIVGARRVNGRWPTKGALEFKRPGDRVRVQIPGEFSSLTFACWVKIDSLDRWYNSLFLTDNYNQGEPHWQILDTGQLFFSVRTRPDSEDPSQWTRPPHRTVLSPPFWQPSMSGKWLHLATTYDVESSRTSHYLNGELLHSEVIPDDQLVRTTRIGAASIGNWSLPTRPDAEFAIRNLNGSFDEFAIFSAALDADEIKEIYENGKP